MPKYISPQALLCGCSGTTNCSMFKTSQTMSSWQFTFKSSFVTRACTRRPRGIIGSATAANKWTMKGACFVNCCFWSEEWAFTLTWNKMCRTHMTYDMSNGAKAPDEILKDILRCDHFDNCFETQTAFSFEKYP